MVSQISSHGLSVRKMENRTANEINSSDEIWKRIYSNQWLACSKCEHHSDPGEESSHKR